jgi:hypothetical protein
MRTQISFSPDSKHVAYWAGNHITDNLKLKMFIVVDGMEVTDSYDWVWGSGIVFDGPNRCHTIAIRDKEYFRIEIEVVEQTAASR